MSAPSPGPHLIINADDYGYFRCVSDGILEAAMSGIVTATGVFANAPHFGEYAARLRECEGLDTGNHLNLTYGTPLTRGMAAKLARWSGRFPGKFAIASAVLSGAISGRLVRDEWKAQVERSLGARLRVRFLNSHEHVHMLPQLYAVVMDLAREYGVAHVRFVDPQVTWNSPTGLFRSAVLKALTLPARKDRPPAPDFLGLEASGRIDVRYLQTILRKLHPAKIYELMCHPGRFDASEIDDHRLRDYHDWEGELGTLMSPQVRELLSRHGVRLIGYRNLEVRDARIAVRPQAVAAA